MRVKSKLFIFLFLIISVSVSAQTHTSVSLNSHIYYILEQAELRGLCSPLSGFRPYTRNVVLKAISEVMSPENAGKLRAAELEILEQYYKTYSLPEAGLDTQRGLYRSETTLGENDTLFSTNIGIGFDAQVYDGFYIPSNENYIDFEIWASVYLNGDLGKNVSYEMSAEAGLFRVQRDYYGTSPNYYDGFDMGDDSEYQYYDLDIYGNPLTHFPFTYRKRWDGSVHHLDNLSGFTSWPSEASVGYNILGEFSSSFMEDKLILRFGRTTHDWGTAPLGSSLSLNQAARPFLAFEAEFAPFSWLRIGTMTGILEFFNEKGEKPSAMTFQNAYSTSMIQLSYENYLFLDIGETVVWPKRLELGYLFPFTSAMIYQHNSGDFDNMALFLNLRAQYPGIGNIWFSFFLDESNFEERSYELDRHMAAYQTGINLTLPFLAFSSVKFSYTRINPYTYTHNRNQNPWYHIPMETSYTNNGVSLGYYLPPNSDEFKVRFTTMPANNLVTYLQYQLIRHGADYGEKAVDGSNLRSELDPWYRSENPILRRYFLQDGAYQWLNVIMLGAEWRLPTFPMAIFAEGGVNISYFTDIEGPANSGEPSPYYIIDTDEYPKSTGFIFMLGIKFFPK